MLIGRLVNSTGPKDASFHWAYTTSFIILIGLILTFSTVLIIDIIIQSRTYNSHLATNTVIIMVFIALFVISYATIDMFRLIYNRIILEEIPKNYVPVSEKDIGSSFSSKIEQTMIRCQKIKKMAKPIGNINHPGLFHQSGNDNNNDNDNNELPDNLIYENVVRIIGQEIKYNGTLTINENGKYLKLDNHYSLSELLENYSNNDEKINNFLKLYEDLRFSGKPITLDQFKDFLQGWNYVKSQL